MITRQQLIREFYQTGVTLGAIFGFIIGLCLASLIWSCPAIGEELGDNLCPSPIPEAPVELVAGGEYVTPPFGGEVEQRVSAGGVTGTFTFTKHNIAVAWDDGPPIEPTEPWLDPRYWWLTDEAGAGTFNAYCRFDCTNRNADPAQDSDWLCRTECVTIGDSGYQLELLTSTDCGETWAVAWTQPIRLIPVVTVRRVTGRVKP